MAFDSSRHTAQPGAYRTPRRSTAQTASNSIIERLIQPQIVANWSLNEEGQVVCLWENPSSMRQPKPKS